MPLYLEWAPLDIISKDAPAVKVVEKNKPDKQKKSSNISISKENEGGVEPQNATEQSGFAGEYGTVYVKNLNFKTTIADVHKHLTQVLRNCQDEDIRMIVIPTKAQKSGNSDVQLSMGYGFIELRTSQIANNILNKLHGSVLDGHKLEAKISEKKLQTSSTNANRAKTNTTGGSSNKIVIRNLAFQTTVAELKKLCSVYGNIKNIRLPKKVINGNNDIKNQHRGFAFVEFHSKKEAELAMEQLKNIHLYGRHLVCEYAEASSDMQHGDNLSNTQQSNYQNNQDLNTLRKKAKRDLSVIERVNNTNKKAKLDEGGDGLDTYAKGSMSSANFE